MNSNLLTQYRKTIAPQLMKDLGLKNVMQLPKIEKICVNVGMGTYLQQTGKDFSRVENNITSITGQKPTVRKSRLSVSNFKLREGMPVGMAVTLRNDAAYNFLDKLINIVYPRVRGFQGVSPKCFDKDGNCSVGFNEHTVFPEVEMDNMGKLHGVQVTIVTNTKEAEHSKKLLEAFGFPFKK